MARRKLRLPFDLADLRGNGVTRLRYKDGTVEVELELAPAAPVQAKPKDAFEAAWVDGDEESGPEAEGDDQGDPRFLLERIAVANGKAM